MFLTLLFMCVFFLLIFWLFSGCFLLFCARVSQSDFLGQYRCCRGLRDCVGQLLALSAPGGAALSPRSGGAAGRVPGGVRRAQEAAEAAARSTARTGWLLALIGCVDLLCGLVVWIGCPSYLPLFCLAWTCPFKSSKLPWFIFKLF
jgi:hypothetical protein